MQITEDQLRTFIYHVVNELNSGSGEEKPGTASNGALGQFTDVDEAVAAAQDAQRRLGSLSLEKRAGIIENIRRKAESNAELLGKMAREETGMGRAEDKIRKNILAARKTPGIEDLKTEAFTGDDGMTLVERAPFGVIGSIIPSTNPTGTVINNSISMIAGGNGAVFNPHPSAKRSSCKTVEIVNRAVVEAGGPENIVTCMVNPTMESGNAIMHHPKIRLLSITGGPGIVKAAMKSEKR